MTDAEYIAVLEKLGDRVINEELTVKQVQASLGALIMALFMKAQSS